ncbi:MAG: Calx-beta domain-containing protein [Thermoanaerobaculia bacterium]
MSLRTPAALSVLALALGAAALAAPALATGHSVTAGPGTSFSPKNLTITAGDTVTWTNVGGTHNVAADDGSFRCANGCDGMGGNGNPATGWSFTLTFNSAGSIPYHCEVHGGSGMTGTITVEAGQSNPGQIKFNASSYSVGEGGGSKTITVQRVNGDDGAVSVHFATSNGSATAGSDYTANSGTLNWADHDSADKTFSVAILQDAAAEGSETVNLTLSAPTGGATLTSPSAAPLTITDDDQGTSQPGTLRFTASAVSIDEDEHMVTLEVERVGGADGAVSAAFATAAGSATADADYETTNGTVSFGDGDAAAKQVQVHVLDDATSEDDETFTVGLSSPTGGAAIGTPSSATVTIEDDDIDTSPCVADATTLCLNENGRFRVRMRWSDFQGGTFDANAVPNTRDSGFFYFLDPNNLEVLVKVLNACVPFEHYWFFGAAASNVGFEITVTDTVGATQQSYYNDLGVFSPAIGDTTSFATCP